MWRRECENSHTREKEQSPKDPAAVPASRTGRDSGFASRCRAHGARAYVFLLFLAGSSLEACRLDAEEREQLARSLSTLTTTSGLRIAFVSTARPDSDEHVTAGVLQEPLEPAWCGAGVQDCVRARPAAGFAPWRLSIENPAGQPLRTITLRLDNVSPRDTIMVCRDDGSCLATARPVENTSLSWCVDLKLGSGEAVRVGSSLTTATFAERSEIAVAGDIQEFPTPWQLLWILQRLREEIAAGRPYIGIVIVGDLADDATPEQLDVVYDILSTSPVSVAVLPGNHDVTPRHNTHFSVLFGPGTYAFDAASTHFVLLDDANGYLAPSVEAAIPALLSHSTKHLIVFSHIPLFHPTTFPGLAREDQALSVLETMATAKPDLLVAGHVHHLWHWTGTLSGWNIEEAIVGTAGGDQGVTTPLFGYARLSLDPHVHGVPWCFVPVPNNDPAVAPPPPDQPSIKICD